MRGVICLDPPVPSAKSAPHILQNLESSVPLPSFFGEVGLAPAFDPCASRASRPLLFIAAFALLAALAGCASSRGGPIPYNPTGFVAPDSPSTQALEDDYKIAPLDTLHIEVFQVPDLTRDFDVDLTGMISMPLIGSVKAVGLTTAQLD